jgi:hypothetical protein
VMSNWRVEDTQGSSSLVRRFARTTVGAMKMTLRSDIYTGPGAAVK